MSYRSLVYSHIIARLLADGNERFRQGGELSIEKYEVFGTVWNWREH
jgi:hypothetical protein